MKDKPDKPNFSNTIVFFLYKYEKNEAMVLFYFA